MIQGTIHTVFHNISTVAHIGITDGVVKEFLPSVSRYVLVACIMFYLFQFNDHYHLILS